MSLVAETHASHAETDRVLSYQLQLAIRNKFFPAGDPDAPTSRQPSGHDGGSDFQTAAITMLAEGDKKKSLAQGGCMKSTTFSLPCHAEACVNEWTQRECRLPRAVTRAVPVQQNISNALSLLFEKRNCTHHIGSSHCNSCNNKESARARRKIWVGLDSSYQ